MRLLLLLCCALTFTGLQAQDVIVDADGPSLVYRAETETEDLDLGLNYRGRERTLLGDLDLSGVWAGPTYNYSMTGDDWALVRGGFGGLEFGNDFFLGYGGWKGREAFTVDNPDDNSPEFDFRHGGLILAYTPFSDNAIHPRITTIFGPGKVDVAGEGRDRMLVGQAMVGLELNLFQWFRLGAEGGYRFTTGIDSELITDQDVSGAVVQLEARFGFSW
ncbi:MAG: hypothetical protein AAF840_10535 [Bacteroidota bacterium]